MNLSPQESWVVYFTVGRMESHTACEQDEWERMTAARPDLFILILDGISTEEEAEWLAHISNRGESQETIRQPQSATPTTETTPWRQYWLTPQASSD